MSEETKFTPGPWIPRAENSPVIVEGSDPGHVIATVAPKKGHANHQSEFGMFGSIPRLRLSSEERSANAALIAAAPELYAMVEKLADELYVLAVFAGDGDEDFPLVDEARLLLSKARGEETK